MTGTAGSSYFLYFFFGYEVERYDKITQDINSAF
jgi:hypothetical protein